MPIAVTAALLLLLSSHSGAETPWAMEAGLWRNVTREPSGYDAGMAAIDSRVDPDGLTERARHLRALVSGFDAVEHYRAKDNLSLLVRAVGSGTYPGYPAVDVLARSWQIDEERRTWFRDGSRGLAAWSRGEEVDRTLTLDGEPVQEEVYGSDEARQRRVREVPGRAGEISEAP